MRRQSGSGPGDVHVGDQMLGGLEGRDRPAELVAQLGVFDGAVQRGPAGSDQVERSKRHGGVGDPTQRGAGDAVEHRGVGADAYVVETHGARPIAPAIASGCTVTPSARGSTATTTVRPRGGGDDEDVGDVGVGDVVRGSGEPPSALDRRRPAGSARSAGETSAASRALHNAVVPRQAPAVRCGNHAALAAGAPSSSIARTAAMVLCTDVGHNARPASTEKTARSSSEPPEPPCSGATASPNTPASASAFHSAGVLRSVPGSSRERTRLTGHSAASNARIVAPNSRCSTVGVALIDQRPYEGIPWPRWAMMSRSTSLVPPPKRINGADR